ncbi:Glycosyl hydrolases family 2 [Chitinophaga costaii]|uniref:Glycosyl hydrolases family 2 n=1 Tax=Chitinophaga costaii TaxID=1335309 RepID=A0A1C3Z0Q7_9BACT|nr:glycosyl hydrolase [Chitinophaga costaii]PUZ30182.1 glycosyl hydrolase [Chitinophaga costaii]SCB75850.1 Glycosyl hydrolases family 2 [Chitinophaga costaii]
MIRILKIATFLLLTCLQLTAQQHSYELNSGWQCKALGSVKAAGEAISIPTYPLQDWLPATVPGTVLTTLLNNKQVPDPFYGMNNQRIPDIYFTGRDHYTYWFVKDFTETVPAADGQVWLHFRGVNDGCDIFLNGHRLNATTHFGAYLRQTYNITPFLNRQGKNRLAVIVYPAPVPGNPNGGQGGDGTIARNVGPQYTAGWDWIQPMRDRNTGIWDKVTIEKTGAVRVKDPHVVTKVPGQRWPGKLQAPALLEVAADLENASAKSCSGTLRYTIDGITVSKAVTIAPHASTTVQLPVLTLPHPRLWWPAGYGDQPLYHTTVAFVTNGSSSDEASVEVGVREIQTSWNTHTGSREVAVNGQKIFIKGGDWITSDAMFRFSKERYDAEVRFHRDMNLNLIRIWGGSLTERPEFFEACDHYGLLVFQDFWMSGDCNGRWVDPMKKDDQLTRRQYPDDHALFVNSIADQVKLLRNYASLAFWCGGNEITPPQDIFHAIKDSILPTLDNTRYFFDYSNSDSMSYNTLGGNGDGPYTIQPLAHFWHFRTFPFNSEVGSVGVGDLLSLQRFLPAQNLVMPDDVHHKTDSVWAYHKYIPYDTFHAAYGPQKNLEQWANTAQLINYDQYRALMEGFSAHMWDWYTGVIIWKTQNPWSALRGQMYDYYLDPNACLYGLRNGGTPLHVMYDPVEGMVEIVNNHFQRTRDLMLEVKAYDMQGHDTLLTQLFVETPATGVQKYLPLKRVVDGLRAQVGTFLSLRLLNLKKEVVDENIYWLPNANGQYSGLQQMPAAQIQLRARKAGAGTVAVTMSNPAGAPVAFFNRLSLVKATDKQRILPVFYSDNYITVAPGSSKTITISGAAVGDHPGALVEVYGQNVARQYVSIE